MKYIIFWTIVIQVPCYFSTDKMIDEFGRDVTGVLSAVPAVACIKIENKPMHKEFDNRDSAVAFYERAAANGLSPKIDSLTNER